MAYNMTPFIEAKDVAAQFVAINTISGNLLVYFTIISLFIILVIIMLFRGVPPQETFTAASATTTVVSLIFLSMGVLPVLWVVGSSVLFGISAVALYVNK